MRMLKKYFSGNKKYISLIALLIFAIVLFGIIEPLVVEKKDSNWDSELKEKNSLIENSATEIFNSKQNSLINNSRKIKEKVRSLKTGENYQYNLFEYLKKINEQGYTAEIYNTPGALIAWNKNILADSVSNIAFNKFLGETQFTNSDLIIYLSYPDTLLINDEINYLLISLPLEKEYSLRNDYYENISLIEKLSTEFKTTFNIFYDSNASYSLDGRRYSFDLLNNKNRKIGVATFLKPSKDSSINYIKEDFKAVQAILVLLGFIVAGFGLHKYYIKIEKRFVKFLWASLYIALLRVLLFILGIPSEYIPTELANASFFSSAFGFGIVKSPLEFFITVFSFLFISLFTYKFATEYLKEKHKEKSLQIFSLLLIGLTAFYFISLRGFGAAIRSVIFDSTLRYFKEPDLIPATPVALMHIGVLITGFCSILFSVVVIILIFKNAPSKFVNKKYVFTGSLFLFFQAAGIIYDVTQKQPQGTPLIRVIHVSVCFILAFMIFYSNKRSLMNYVYFLFAASFVSISLLSHYNLALERESLKIIAREITRPNKNLLEFFLTQTLENAVNRPEIAESFYKTNYNYEAAAFKIWSRSPLQRESVISSINFLNSSKENLGGINFGIFDIYDKRFGNSINENQKIVLWEEEYLYSSTQLLKGLGAIESTDGKLLGYIEVNVLHDINNLGLFEGPELFSTKSTYSNLAVDLAKIKIFDFHEGELLNTFSEVTLSSEQEKIIIESPDDHTNEAWLSLNFNNEDNLVYVFNTKLDDIKRTIAVALESKTISWNLFDFFKVFFIHSFFIILLIIITVVIGLGRKKISGLSFRAQLLTAFLVISIIPLILLAIYFRSLTEESNNTAAFYKLGKRAVRVEKYINDYLITSGINIKNIFDKASRDLGVSYEIYDDKKLIYSSEELFHKIGLVPDIISPEAYNKIINKGIKETVVEEKIEKFSFNSFYYKGRIGNKDYIIKISDGFNNILLPMSATDVDIFLFGSYSLAVILIIIFSTLLANQISLPVRKLTIATRSVASGDLNVELKENSRGETKELIEGFNKMVRELKKSQLELAELERESAWKEMAKQVAHEIKNPLTPMKLAVQQLMIAHKDQSPKFNIIFEKVTNTVINQIETLKNIASEFYNFARMPNLKLEKIILQPIINDAANLFIEEAANIIVDVPAEQITTLADKDQVKRTIINLIRNSVQANASSIKINYTSGNDFHIINIIDNGKGIEPEVANKIFDANFTTKVKGMGLGLSMAKNFMESISGEILLKETSTNGTTIQLKFPKI